MYNLCCERNHSCLTIYFCTAAIIAGEDASHEADSDDEVEEDAATKEEGGGT